jgi:GntR family transcriptional regulator, rspAB operon transcriptional repressor
MLRPAADASEQEGMLDLGRRPDSLTHSVYNAIRQAIIDGRLPPGSRVTEAGLAKRLNVSKTPVREALLRLKEVGLIEAEGAKAGGRIISPSRSHTRNAYEVREALESAAARLAALRGDRALLFAAKREAEATVVAAEDRDVARYRAADDAFHATVAAATGNPRLARLIDDTNALIGALRQREMPGVDASPACASQHMKIAKVLLDGDADAASRLMSQHVQHVAEEVLSYFKDQD